jgi:hypothetical protein
MQAPIEDCSEVLLSVPWVPTNSSEFDPSDQEKQKKLVAIQHALANRIVGFFCVRLRLYRITTPCQDGLYGPPSALTIPFFRQMNLPVPFIENSLESFCKCDLPAMADPTFITKDQWTGCTGLFDNPLGYPFNAIGGQHAGGFEHPPLSARPGTYPNGRAFEGVVRFQLVRENNISYTLQSNNFHSEVELHRIRLDITRETGQLTMHHWHRMRTDFMTTYGVITPFGIVSHFNLRSIWLWLWKVEWSTEA